MVSSCLGGELSTGFLGDPISKSGLTALELAGLRVCPVGDLLLILIIRKRGVPNKGDCFGYRVSRHIC